VVAGPDGIESNATSLTIIGTDKDDTIDVKTVAGGKLSVKVNGKNYGPFNVDGHILAFGLKGNDKITIDSAIGLPAFLFGGEGKDTLTGGGGNDLILGEKGDDKLYGRAGRDVLIGGDQKDQLDGGAGEDLLSAGDTNLGNDLYKLVPVATEWNRTDLPFAQRLAHITSGGPGAKNGGNLINANTASSGSTPPDTLTGGSDGDAFFYNFNQKGKDHDKVTDLTAIDAGIDVG
jgi:Ca2+-binding RTX toxin-like protein